MYYDGATYDTYEEAADAADSLGTFDVKVMPTYEGYILLTVSNYRYMARDEASSLFDGGWRPGKDTVDELIAEYGNGKDDPAWREWGDTVNGYLQEFLDDYSPIDADSFGAGCPDNWEEIAEALNQYIRRTGADPEQAWEDWCFGGLVDVPEPVFQDEEG